MEARKMNDVIVSKTQELLSRLKELKATGGRLSAITGVDRGIGDDLTEKIEVIYSIDVALALHNIRILIDADVEHVSVADIFPNAWMPENELSEMFGIKIRNIKGRLLLTDEVAEKAPLRKSTRIEDLKGGF